MVFWESSLQIVVGQSIKSPPESEVRTCGLGSVKLMFRRVMNAEEFNSRDGDVPDEVPTNMVLLLTLIAEVRGTVEVKFTAEVKFTKPVVMFSIMVPGPPVRVLLMVPFGLLRI